jgi:hypothetical protein
LGFLINRQRECVGFEPTVDVSLVSKDMRSPDKVFNFKDIVEDEKSAGRG